MPPDDDPRDRPIDIQGIAERIGRAPGYVRNQLSRSQGFPTPQPDQINGGRWWWASEIEAWIVESGRE